jgi:hypothetical protein
VNIDTPLEVPRNRLQVAEQRFRMDRRASLAVIVSSNTQIGRVPVKLGSSTILPKSPFGLTFGPSMA